VLDPGWAGKSNAVTGERHDDSAAAGWCVTAAAAASAERAWRVRC
jgi:hypothetical protein